MLPNDPAVSRLLKAAAQVLARAGKRDAIDGRQSGSRERTCKLASAVWSAVVALRLTYAEPPASFEVQGQKVRTPTASLETGLATRLDTALLFAATLEQAGLHPVLVMTEGHALAGVWLQPQELATLLVEDAAALRKRLACRSWCCSRRPWPPARRRRASAGPSPKRRPPRRRVGWSGGDASSWT